MIAIINKKDIQKLGACDEGMVFYEWLAMSLGHQQCDGFGINWDKTAMLLALAHPVARGHFRWAMDRGILPTFNFCKEDFRGFDLSGMDLSGLRFIDCDFSGADLQGASLRGCVLNYSNFRGAKMDHASLRRARGHKVAFDMASLRRVDFYNSEILFVSLEGADLTEARVRKNMTELPKKWKIKKGHAVLRK